jgi:hypothetical protein
MKNKILPTPIIVIIFLLYTIDSSKAQTQISNSFSRLNAATTSLEKNIRSIFQDSKGNYWFGTNGAGVYRYDTKTLTQFTIKAGLADNQGLFFYDLNNEKLHKLNNEVVNIVSVQGNFVYVSLISKVLIIKPENDKIHAFRNAEEIFLSKSEKIYSFYYDTDTKNLLLGTFDNGVILINKQRKNV